MAEDGEWPEWLKVVAGRVNDLVQTADSMDRFRRMLRDWRAEHGRRDTAQYNEVEILPAAMRLPAKYAAVAAIHDEVCKNVRPIDPWGMYRPFSTTGLSRRKAGLSYSALRYRVADLEDKHRSRVERILKDVVANISTALSSADERPPTLAPNNAAEATQMVEPFDDDAILTPGLTPVAKPGGWTKSELVEQAKDALGGSFSGGTFDNIRRAAGVKSGPRGGGGQQYRFRRTELTKLINAVEAGNFRNKTKIAASWRQLLAK